MRGGQVYRVRVAAEAERALGICRSVAGVGEASLEEDGRIRVVLAGDSPDPALLAAAIVHAGLRLTGLEEEEIGLEEVFMHVTRGETQ